MGSASEDPPPVIPRKIDRVRDPGLRARIRGFYGREARHGHEHTRSFEMLRQQPGFHPDDKDNYPLAAAYLAGLEERAGT